MEEMSPTRGQGPRVFEKKNDLSPQEDLYVLGSWNIYTKQIGCEMTLYKRCFSTPILGQKVTRGISGCVTGFFFNI